MFNKAVIIDTFTTGGTFTNNIVYFNKNNTLSAYTVNLSALTTEFVNVTGDTMTGTLYVPTLSATTISGNTIYGNGSNLTGVRYSGLSDVSLTSLTNSDLSIWNSGTTKWENTNIVVDAGDWGGFTNNTNITVTYDPSTRKVSLNGSFKLYYGGRVILDYTSGGTWTSEAHPSGATTTQYLYYNNNGFQWASSLWSFSDAQIAAVIFTSDGVQRYTLREVHGLMPSTVHSELHKVIGTFLDSGGDLTNYTANTAVATARRPYVTAAVVVDEDLQTTVPIFTGASFTQMYLTGSTSTTMFTTGATDMVPLSTNQPFYNQFTAGAWTQTLMTANNYMSIWVIAVPIASDSVSQAYRFIWLQGQSQQASLAAAQAVNTGSLNLGSIPTISPEYVFIAKIIIRYVSGNWQIIQVDKITGSRFSQSSSTSGGYLSSVSTDGTTILGNGSASLPIYVNPDLVLTDLTATTFISTAALSATTITGTTLYGNGANLTGIAHNTVVTGLQGGTSGQYYHLTQAEYNSISGNNLTNNFVNTSGDTMTGTLNGTAFSANTISGVTFYGSGSGLTNVKPQLTKTMTIVSATTEDNFTLFRATSAVTIQAVTAVIVTGGTSCNVQVNKHADRSTTGTTVVTSVAVTNNTTGQTLTVITAGNANKVAAGEWVWITTPTVTSQPKSVTIDVRYTED